MTNTIAVVGNADLREGLADEIDCADKVIRFNYPRTLFHSGGNKFDIWVLANAGAGKAFAEQKPFLQQEFKDIPTQLWFPRVPSVHQKLEHEMPGLFKSENAFKDFSLQIIQSNNLKQSELVYNTEENYWACIELLRQLGSDFIMPSSGFLTLYTLLFDNLYAFGELKVFGFTFEGWEGHPWEYEKYFVEDWHNKGKLSIL